MNQAKIDLRIGELLIESGILTSDDLEEAMKTAQGTGLPVGRVLIMAGFVTESEFQASVQAQSLVRDSIVPLAVAIQALKLVAEDDLAFEQALKQSGFEQRADMESNKLGELLLAASIVPRQSLDTTMRTCLDTGLPLGRLLISLGLVSNELLATALNAQQLIRSGRITRLTGINGLRAAHQRRSEIEHVLSEQGFYRGPQRPSIRLGELLNRAGLISHDDVAMAIETGLVEEKAIGQVLVEAELIERPMLDNALKLQEMVANETLSADQAVHTLRQLLSTDCPLPQALAVLEVGPEEFKTKVRYIEVLKVAGLLSPAEDRFYATKPEHPNSADALYTARALMQDGVIDERVFLGSLRCYFLIATGWLNMQQGIIALNYFHHKQCTFDQVLHELKWTVHTYARTKEEEGLLGSSGPDGQEI